MRTTPFEQVAVQLQRFPEPPRPYLPHSNEPPVQSTARLRVIVAPTGAGKTAWAAHVAENSTRAVAYFDVSFGRGGALASGITRELAATFLSQSNGGLNRVLLPGASGLEALGAVSRELQHRGLGVTILLDNAQHADVGEIRAILAVGEGAIQWIVLTQPGRSLAAVEASFAIHPERLEGWAIETVAAAFTSEGLVVAPDVASRVQRLTGSIPLFVREFVLLAKERGKAPAALCDEFEAQAHLEPTRQEAILESILGTLPTPARKAATALALCEVPLQPEELTALLEGALTLAGAAARATRDLSARGILGSHPDGAMAVLDAFRLPLLASNEDPALVAGVNRALSAILISSLREGLQPERLLALLKLLPKQGETKAFLDIVSSHSEQIDELGLMSPIERVVVAASRDSTLPAEDRFWAFDILAYLKRGPEQHAAVSAMRALVENGSVGGREERLELANKLIVLATRKEDLESAREAFARGYAIAASEEERLLLRYTMASTCLLVGRHREAERTGLEIVRGYYALLAIDEGDVHCASNADIFSRVATSEPLGLKRIADAHALVAMARDAMFQHPGYARLEAMRFYTLAQSPVSAVRVGLDAVTDFLRHGSDLRAAMMILDQHIEPVLVQFRLADWVVPVTSMRAVLLAYAGRIEEARALVVRAAPLAKGLVKTERDTFERQRSLVEELASDPKKWLV